MQARGRLTATPADAATWRHSFTAAPADAALLRRQLGTTLASAAGETPTPESAR
ncbi:hypothetical protein AMETH_6575 [Amycolatopsis methanolica 239]|uniref:Uncharacterized protein n=1 Tax=Amycolatopsis methanolica 239 TaxID=1068978 RepID=A0A076N9G4_AMYME|nr:hypothetical protein AMETH_6575 [Amycolatopsis methanolica 239]